MAKLNSILNTVYLVGNAFGKKYNKRAFFARALHPRDTSKGSLYHRIVLCRKHTNRASLFLHNRLSKQHFAFPLITTRISVKERVFCGSIVDNTGCQPYMRLEDRVAYLKAMKSPYPQVFVVKRQSTERPLQCILFKNKDVSCLWVARFGLLLLHIASDIQYTKPAARDVLLSQNLLKTGAADLRCLFLHVSRTENFFIYDC